MSTRIVNVSNFFQIIKQPLTLSLLVFLGGLLFESLLDFIGVSPIVIFHGFSILFWLTINLYLFMKSMKESSNFENTLSVKEKDIFKKEKNIVCKYFFAAMIVSVGGMIMILLINLINYSSIGIFTGFLVSAIVGLLIIQRGVKKAEMLCEEKGL